MKRSNLFYILYHFGLKSQAFSLHKPSSKVSRHSRENGNPESRDDTMDPRIRGDDRTVHCSKPGFAQNKRCVVTKNPDMRGFVFQMK